MLLENLRENAVIRIGKDLWPREFIRLIQKVPANVFGAHTHKRALGWAQTGADSLFNTPC